VASQLKCFNKKVKKISDGLEYYDSRTIMKSSNLWFSDTSNAGDRKSKLNTTDRILENALGGNEEDKVNELFGATLSSDDGFLTKTLPDKDMKMYPDNLEVNFNYTTKDF
jgi:hypothetical protein